MKALVNLLASVLVVVSVILVLTLMLFKEQYPDGEVKTGLIFAAFAFTVGMGVLVLL